MLPWVEMERNKEFRVFVFHDEMTAISQQHLYEPNEWLAQMSDVEIVSLMRKIETFFYECVRSKLKFLGDYTMDIAFDVNNDLYFIEPNPFGEPSIHYWPGRDSPAGSALFHWDERTLEDPYNIELRFVSMSSL